MSRFSLLPRQRTAGLTLMEILVVVAIILVLAVISLPVISVVKQRANKVKATKLMQNLGAAAGGYVQDNNGEFPKEDAKGKDDWGSARDPASKDAWYNALPKRMGSRSVAEFADDPRAFYTEANPLFVPGAEYPGSDKKLAKPLFAIAINSKLQRRNEDGVKVPLRIGSITEPVRTVLFLEQGLPSEKKTNPVQSKYNGSPKGSAKSFVGRYSGQGILTFMDGHAESADPKETLNENGSFPYPQTDFIWTRDREEDPNK